MVIGEAAELIGAGLDSEITAVAEVASCIVVLTVKVAPAIFEIPPVMFNNAGLYSNAKLPDVTFRPLLRATGIPLLGMALERLIFASPMDTPGVVEERS